MYLTLLFLSNDLHGSHLQLALVIRGCLQQSWSVNIGTFCYIKLPLSALQDVDNVFSGIATVYSIMISSVVYVFVYRK